MDGSRVALDRQTLNIEQAAKVLGISRPVAYRLASEDRLPIPVIRAGRRLLVSRRALDELLDRRHADRGDSVA